MTRSVGGFIGLKGGIAKSGQPLSLTTETEHRELEHCFYAEPTSEFFERLKELVVPSTVNDRVVPVIDDGTAKVYHWYTLATVEDHTQFQVRDDGIALRVRRVMYLCGRTEYVLCAKVKENGITIEAEQTMEGTGMFSIFNVLLRNSEEGMWKTRVSFRTADDSLRYEVDVPLLSGNHCRDLNAEWGKVIKVDLEHGGNIALNDAINLFPVPVKRLITDKDEIHQLYETTFRRKLK